SLLLAFAGGICAAQVAMWFSDWVAARTVGDSTEGLVLLTLDWRVLSWAFGACLFTALAFGMAPALFALRLDLNSTLKSGARARRLTSARIRRDSPAIQGVETGPATLCRRAGPWPVCAATSYNEAHQRGVRYPESLAPGKP